MFGRVGADHVIHRYDKQLLPGVTYVQATVEAIEPEARRVHTDAGTFTPEILVVALGADVDPAATPGLVDAGQEFYTVAGAFATRDVLAGFTGGRVVVGVTSTPFKCPPAPSETALLTHELLERRGLLGSSQVTLVMPFGIPIPPSPQGSKEILTAFADRGIAWRPERMVLGLDGERGVVLLSNGEELPYDLFLGVPIHRAPQVVVDSRMTVDGWIPVDRETLETRYPSVYAVGDVTSVGTPKAGVFSEGQGAVVADRIVAAFRGSSPDAVYGGRGLCYMEFGRHEVAKVDVTFRRDVPPAGTMEGPSTEFAREKSAFGTERVRRWFDRSWTPVPG
jgi:sulfide:quinone oxidoreductase